jgi:hypothetical protein
MSPDSPLRPFQAALQGLNLQFFILEPQHNWIF